MSGSHHEPVFVQGEARYRDARRVTLVGAVVNIVPWKLYDSYSFSLHGRTTGTNIVVSAVA